MGDNRTGEPAGEWPRFPQADPEGVDDALKRSFQAGYAYRQGQEDGGAMRVEQLAEYLDRELRRAPCNVVAGMPLGENCSCSHVAAVHSRTDGVISCDICALAARQMLVVGPADYLVVAIELLDEQEIAYFRDRMAEQWPDLVDRVVIISGATQLAAVRSAMVPPPSDNDWLETEPSNRKGL